MIAYCEVVDVKDLTPLVLPGWTEPPSISWPAVSGPHGKGALPDGWYYLTGEEKPVKSEANSMTDTCENKNTYKFRLHPQFDTDRDGLLIHPDGGPPGTAGCIGATGCTQTLRDFINRQIKNSIGGQIPVLVR